MSSRAPTGPRCDAPLPARRAHRRHRDRQVHRGRHVPRPRRRRHRRRRARARGGRAGGAGTRRDRRGVRGRRAPVRWTARPEGPRCDRLRRPRQAAPAGGAHAPADPRALHEAGGRAGGAELRRRRPLRRAGHDRERQLSEHGAAHRRRDRRDDAARPAHRARRLLARRGPAQDPQPDAARREGQARRLRDRQLRRPRGDRTVRASRPRRTDGRAGGTPARRRVSSTRRRALGQHFLRDAGTAGAIVAVLAPDAPDVVVEIGPGDGALTAELARRGARVTALEVDRVLIARLRDRFPGVEVLEADAREWDYASLRAAPGGRVLVVGNLPYSVGTKILISLVRAHGAIDEMALMLQREVAERVAAPPGSKVYASLSILCQLHWDVRLALRVPPGAFRPPPRVDSAVLHLRALPAPRVALADERRFEAVVRAAFAQRRKTLANALSGGLGIPTEGAREAAEAAGIDPRRRAETLSISEFASLAARL